MKKTELKYLIKKLIREQEGRKLPLGHDNDGDLNDIKSNIELSLRQAQSIGGGGGSAQGPLQDLIDKLKDIIDIIDDLEDMI